MSLKLRFALLFSFFVAVILLISFATIYFLYYNYRESEFFERLKKEGMAFHHSLTNDDSLHRHTLEEFNNIMHYSTIYDEHVVMLDTAGNILRKIPEGSNVSINKEAVQETVRQEIHYWYDGARYQYAGVKLPGNVGILLTGGYDKVGLQKLANLRMILVFVFIGGMMFTAFMAFIFVREAFMPLKNLSMQIRQTTVQDLGNRRLSVGRAKDEINDIARNYNAMLERLASTFEFQKSFVFHASHEFRTPLATMLSETESALSKELNPDEYKKVLLSLKEEQQDLIELTNSLLLISQSEDLGYTRNWPMLRIDEVLYDTISQVRKMFPQLKVEMRFATMPESPDDFVVQGNEILLRSVFINLIKNAYMYSIDKQVHILLESAGDTILVHFDNTGMQLPNDEKQNILLPFFRGGNALKTKGYGLGLAIVARFIAIHKGSIVYTPIANDSNRFTITLSRARPAGS
jgi:signal transduction histidine kinase